MASAAPSFMSDLRLAVVVEGAACGSRLSATGTIGLPAVHRSLRSVGPGTANHRRYSPGFGVAKLRSEENPCELQHLMRITYAAFCLQKKQNNHTHKQKPD